MNLRRTLSRGSETAALVALLALPAVWALLAVPDAPAGSNRRIVAVGDVHGAFAPFRKILLRTGLIDEADEWVGGDAVFVQTGDFVDRGAASIPVAYYLMELQRKAAAKGGRAIVLLGNHESMNLLGDMRFVPPEMLRPMVGKDSKKRLASMCKERVAILRRDARALDIEPPPASAARQACVGNHAPGLVEYQAALRPDEPLGSWLRSLPAVARVDDIVFVHGGLSPDMAKRGLAVINETVGRELETFETWRRWLVDQGRMTTAATLMEMARAVQVDLELRRRAAETREEDPAAVASDGNSEAPDLSGFFELSDRLVLHQNGPLWFRGYDAWNEEEGTQAMRGILEAIGARHVVVGHTPQDPRRIRCRFGGGAFLIDTGMLYDYYKGEPAALQFQDGRVEAVYLDETAVLLEADGSGAEECR